MQISNEIGRKIKTLETRLKGSGESRISSEVTQLLERKDETYRALIGYYDQVKRVVGSAGDLLSEISTAESSLSSAQTMEFMDLATENTGISIMSSMSNYSASSDLDDVSRKGREFEAELDKLNGYNNKLGSRSYYCGSETFTIETIDLVFDLSLDLGFDFTSMMSLSSISTAKSRLSSLESSVRRIKEDMETQYKNRETHLRKYVAKTREFAASLN